MLLPRILFFLVYPLIWLLHLLPPRACSALEALAHDRPSLDGEVSKQGRARTPAAVAANGEAGAAAAVEWALAHYG